MTTNHQSPPTQPEQASPRPWDRAPEPCWSCGGEAEARDLIHVRCLDTKNLACDVMNHWYTLKTWNTRTAVNAHEQLLAEVKRLREALERIAAFDDESANEHLARFKSYSRFDEPCAVFAARSALASGVGDASAVRIEAWG